jgi:hypothetical protein
MSEDSTTSLPSTIDKEDLIVNDAEKFNGSNLPIHQFVASIKLIFLLAPKKFSNDPIKCKYLLSRLQGSALDWGINLLRVNESVFSNFDDLIAHLNKEFEDPDLIERNTHKLVNLSQGTDSVRSYANNFLQLARTLEWNEPPLIFHFRHGLNPNIKDSLTFEPYPKILDLAINQAIRADQRVCERTRERRTESFSSSTAHPRTFSTISYSQRDNLQIPPSNLQEIWHKLPEQRQRYMHRFANGQCTMCGSNSHPVENCPAIASKEAGKGRALLRH